MWNRFDKIVCIHYLPYKNERFRNIALELKRVGILGLPQFEWEFTVPNKFYEYIRFPKGASWHISSKERQYSVQYYEIVKKLYMRGYQKVLIIEDDLAFRKDLDSIANILNNTPDDWDIVNYDPFRRKGWQGFGKGYWGHYYDLKGNEVKKDWNEGLFMRYASIVYNASCVAFTQRAMKHFVEKSEVSLGTADGYTWKDTEGLNTYCTTKDNNICIQNRYAIMLNDGEKGTMEHLHKGENLDLYNLKVEDN